MNKIIIGILILLVLVGISLSQKAQRHDLYKATTYSPFELSNLYNKDKDKYVIIDVRTKVEYDAGHIPGAVHADYYDTEALKKAAGNKIPITYCAFSAMRGPYAAYSLYRAGFTNVAVLDGGISAWAEDVKKLDSADPRFKTVFTHPKDIFPKRPKGEFDPKNGEVEFNIIAKQFEFVPNEIKVGLGQKVTLHIKSIDLAHGFALPEFGVEEELLPGVTTEVTFVADRQGTFPFVCSVICGATHNHASMVGNIIVK